MPLSAAPLRRRQLEPEPAVEQRRREGNRVLRSILELERELSHQLARRVLPWVPGTHLPYDWQLRRRLTLSFASLAVPGLPNGWSGVRGLLISDLHVGPFVGRRQLERSLRTLIEESAPEIILLAGDLLSAHVRELRDLEPALRTLEAPLGAWAVLGNHDHYTLQPETVAARVGDCGVQVLNNVHRRLTRKNDELVLAGIDDLDMGQPDLEAALRGVSERDTVLLMSHNPDTFFEAARRGVALQLSGHTHGGQIRRRGRQPPMMASRFPLVHGHYTLDTGDRGPAQLLLSEGLGVVGLPLRITCAPEAIAFELRQVAAAESVPVKTVDA